MTVHPRRAKDRNLTYKGLQVPWVTRWTGEIPADRKIELYRVPGGLRVSYPEATTEYRDRYGVLWQQEGIRRGGEPQFAQVSSHRQRAAMTKGLCQVCGDRIADKPIRWLMDPGQLRHTDNDETLTVSPPTCSACVEIALKACPHLRTHDQVIVMVLEYEIWGVWGDMVRLQDGRLQRKKGVYVPYDDSLNLGAVVAKQQVVKFTKFIIERADYSAVTGMM